MTATFYTTCDAETLRSYMPAAPMMVTATSFWRLGQTRKSLRESGGILTTHLIPEHVPEVAADSGGFEAARRHGGRYPFSFEAYVEWLHQIPRLSWAALPDLPVERQLAPTYANVRERQELTLHWARELWGESTEHYEYHRVPWAWVPTIQGRELADYVWMAEQLAPLLRDQMMDYAYTAYAEDRYPFGDDVEPDAQRYAEAEHGAEHWRVGIGSLCKRSSVAEIVAIVQALAEILPGCRFHLWGVKLAAIPALRAAGLLDRVASLDSSAWNRRFADKIEKQRSSELSQREYAWGVAWPDYYEKVALALEGQYQLPLAGMVAAA